MYRRGTNNKYCTQTFERFIIDNKIIKRTHIVEDESEKNVWGRRTMISPIQINFRFRAEKITNAKIYFVAFIWNKVMLTIEQ